MARKRVEVFIVPELQRRRVWTDMPIYKVGEQNAAKDEGKVGKTGRLRQAKMLPRKSDKEVGELKGGG